MSNIQNSKVIIQNLKTLPDTPGVYQYFDEKANIIYIGKAKNLRKRITSYFKDDSQLNGKLRVLRRKIADIKYILVDTEYDALLLENSLIKKYQPRYNVLLKDDKTYPWICIKNEPFPRVFPTRNLINDGSHYYGPYASLPLMHTMLNLIKSLYPLRNCKLNLTDENIFKKKFRICLEYHIGNCKGPCENRQKKDDYEQNINEIKHIIKGNISIVLINLKDLMMKYADNYEFEKAQLIKEKIELLDKYRSKSIIVSHTINNVDVFSLLSDKESVYINYLKVMKGAIVLSHTIELKKKLDETDDELLLMAIVEFRQRFESNSTEIIIPFKIDKIIPEVKLTIPKIGDKKKLFELSERNVKYYMLEQQKAKELVDPDRRKNRILSQMMKDLRMNQMPSHIECFDNSNFQGAYPVSAMVVFRDARPSKKEYRHYNVKTVEGPDDFATMEEIVFRRYKRLIDENAELPDLIIIDGGKGQLSSAVKSLEKLNLDKKITIVGIAKRLEEIYYPADSIPMFLDKKSETMRILQQIRDEAHRFGITFHRNKRSNGTIKTELSDIKGIGEKTIQLLLEKYKSVAKIKESSFIELETLIGKPKASILKRFWG